MAPQSASRPQLFKAGRWAGAPPVQLGCARACSEAEHGERCGLCHPHMRHTRHPCSHPRQETHISRSLVWRGQCQLARSFSELGMAPHGYAGNTDTTIRDQTLLHRPSSVLLSRPPRSCINTNSLPHSPLPLSTLLISLRSHSVAVEGGGRAGRVSAPATLPYPPTSFCSRQSPNPAQPVRFRSLHPQKKKDTMEEAKHSSVGSERPAALPPLTLNEWADARSDATLRAGTAVAALFRRVEFSVSKIWGSGLGV